jgi:hypothetical protein
MPNIKPGPPFIFLFPDHVPSCGEPFHHEGMGLLNRALQDGRPRRVRLERQSLADVQGAQLPHDGQVAFQHRLLGDHPGERGVEGFIEDGNAIEHLVRDVNKLIGRRSRGARQRVDL